MEQHYKLAPDDSVFPKQKVWAVGRDPMASFWSLHDLYRYFVDISWFHSRRSLIQVTKRPVSRFADNNIQCCRPHRESLTAIYALKNIKKATWCCLLRLVFYPLFAACLNGPKWLKTEIPMAILTFMLGVTNCYLSSVLMILTPKSVSVSEAELSAIAMVVLLGMGLVGGSVIGYFWII